MVEILRILVAKRKVRTMAAVVVEIHVLTICTFHILSQIIFIRVIFRNLIHTWYPGYLYIELKYNLPVVILKT
jgi:hypothetical protein